MTVGKPIILEENKNTADDLESLRKSNPPWKTVDCYELQLRELFEITHADRIYADLFEQESASFVERRKHGPDGGLLGSWIYFPWSGILLHTVCEEEFYALRTNRNKNLITVTEQKILRDSCVGVVGLSVGSHVAISLAVSGIADAMKLTDHDTFDTTNGNRVRARVEHIGMKKSDIVAQNVYETNPFAGLYMYENGLTKETLDEFVSGEPRPKIIFEIIDDFPMKIHLREKAREAGIPVVMMANLGDSILIDIERYDEDHSLPFFNGVVGDVPDRILQNSDMSDVEKNKFAVELVGTVYIPKRALDSVRAIGKTLVGRPQLGSTVTVVGGLAAYIGRQILLGEPMPSGRYHVKFESLFV